MPRRRELTGVIGGADGPDWEPLLAVVGPEGADWFMWMCAIDLSDGTRLQAYKHQMTRRYLYLDDALRPWGYTGAGRYVPRGALAEAVEDVWSSWWLSEHAEAEDAAVAWASIDRAREVDARTRGDEEAP